MDPDSSNGTRASGCGRAYEAALCPEQKTTDSELIIVDRRGAKHCGPSSIFRIVRKRDGQEERCRRGKEKGGWREGGKN